MKAQLREQKFYSLPENSLGSGEGAIILGHLAPQACPYSLLTGQFELMLGSPTVQRFNFNSNHFPQLWDPQFCLPPPFIPKGS